MESTECSDFPVKENIEREEEELNRTEYFEFDTEIKSEDIQQKTESGKAFKCECCDFKSKHKNNVIRHEKSVHLMQKFLAS